MDIDKELNDILRGKGEGTPPPAPDRERYISAIREAHDLVGEAMDAIGGDSIIKAQLVSFLAMKLIEKLPSAVPAPHASADRCPHAGKPERPLGLATGAGWQANCAVIKSPCEGIKFAFTAAHECCVHYHLERMAREWEEKADA